MSKVRIDWDYVAALFEEDDQFSDEYTEGYKVRCLGWLVDFIPSGKLYGLLHIGETVSLREFAADFIWLMRLRIEALKHGFEMQRCELDNPGDSIWIIKRD